MELLRLREAMCNAPHAQQLATQFAADAQEIDHLLFEFNTSCSYVCKAQEGLANAYMRMSEISRQIGGKTQNIYFNRRTLTSKTFVYSSLAFSKNHI
ncbi:hypothetical protein ACTXT7_000477 [Hymenolepis weldensis]